MLLWYLQGKAYFCNIASQCPAKSPFGAVQTENFVIRIVSSCQFCSSGDQTSCFNLRYVLAHSLLMVSLLKLILSPVAIRDKCATAEGTKFC